MKNIDRKVVATVAVFLLLAVVYFIPKPVLRMALPEIMVKYRIVGPLLTLSLAGIFLAPRLMTLAMIFSLCGDYMGAAGNFIGQMSFFAAAHAMLIAFFVQRFRTLPADLQACRYQESLPERGSGPKRCTRQSIDSHMRSDSGGSIADLRIDLHHSACSGRRHPHRMRHLRSSDMFNAGHVNVAAAWFVRAGCGAVPVLRYHTVMAQVRFPCAIQQIFDNDYILFRPTHPVAHRRGER